MIPKEDIALDDQTKDEMQESDIFQSPRDKSPRLTRNSSGVDYVGIMQDAIKADDKPSRLGNLYCFMYRKGKVLHVSNV